MEDAPPWSQERPLSFLGEHVRDGALTNLYPLIRARVGDNLGWENILDTAEEGGDWMVRT